ncbi:uncharacterized protein TNCV_2189891 [Trichonephila clavipes]|nr:uncharacterized protein TNCV_2189891 [Trichonephila clavipes]
MTKLEISSNPKGYDQLTGDVKITSLQCPFPDEMVSDAGLRHWNPGEDMDVCKCIVPSLHGGTLNSRRAASSLVRLVEGGDRWEAPDHPQGVLAQN